MSSVPSSPRVWLRVAAVSFIAVGLAGCSNSGRGFDFGSFSSKKDHASQETTGSIAAKPAPVGKVEAQPLPAPSKPETVAPQAGVSQGAQGLGAYRPSADITGSVSASRPAAPAGHWTWEGGTPVTVGTGESLEVVARKYGVPVSAVMQANNISNAADVRPGQRLVIPRYTVAAVAPQSPPPPVAAPAVTAPRATPAAAPAPAAKAGEHIHVVEPGQSLIGISRHYNVPINTLAKANNILPYAKVNAGDQLKIPAGYAAPAAPQKQAAVVPPPVQQQPVAQPVASAPATQTARMATPEPPKAEPNAVKSADATGALPSFRWPVKGRIITAFGAKGNGTQNDGINIAVPEGTQIKAAEDGVVAYAGSELKGYGNLVLVRHSNGYVSAYAHASELNVQRGDTVKRGQVIGKAGQTGNVTSPQLHFEIRKGSTPVDPSQFLGSQT